MPIMKNSPYRIAKTSSLKQCIFWIAYDQTPLLPDHEDIRENEVKTTYRSLLMHGADEPRAITHAKEQLILSLADGRLIGMGYEGHPAYDDFGRPLSIKTEVQPIHWRSSMEPRDWDDSTLHYIMAGHEISFVQIGIATTNLFTSFPQADMEAVLEGHMNKTDFWPPKTKATKKPLPRQPGEPKPETIDGRKDAYDKIEHWLKILGDKATIKDAAIEAAKEEYGIGGAKYWERLARKRRHYLTYLGRQNGKSVT